MESHAQPCSRFKTPVNVYWGRGRGADTVRNFKQFSIARKSLRCRIPDPDLGCTTRGRTLAATKGAARTSKEPNSPLATTPAKDF